MTIPKTITPLGDKVAIAPTYDTQTESGIWLPDSQANPNHEGRVIAVGEGRVLECGMRRPMRLQAGDKVLYSKYGGTQIKIDGRELVIIDEDQVYGILE